MAKKDAKGEALTFEKVADLYEGMSIWKVSIERCKEQDKNARVMDKATFDRLRLNIEADHKLESLPFGIIGQTKDGEQEFVIISGHHRVRAARAAQIPDIYVLVTDEKLTDDEIKSKQLAHNALAGQDDKQVLKELWDSIKDVEAKIASGIRTDEFDAMKFKHISVEELGIDFEYKAVKMLFLPTQMQRLENVLVEIDEGDTVLVADYAQFDKFAEALRKLSKTDNIRNVGSLVDRMVELTLDYVKNKPAEDEKESTTTKGYGGKNRKKIGFGNK